MTNSPNNKPITSSGELLQALRKFKKPNNRKSIGQIINSLVPYVGIWIAIYFLRNESFLFTLPLLILGGGFLIRIFIIFHDCGHQSFFSSRSFNNFWGVITGIITFTPYTYWSRHHAKHHAASGNLDKRGYGDIWMMTVDEYNAAGKKTKFQYRMYRNPLVMFILGPMFLVLVTNRIARTDANRAEWLSVITSNIGILLLAAGMGLLLGWKTYLLCQGIILFTGTTAGIWLFYVQHQFEGVYWSRNKEWDFVAASLEGGSFYDLPAILRWFTGNIGYHHIHHLDSRIPNYNLPRCQKEIAAFDRVPSIKLLPSLKSLKFRLWDEASNRLVTFREAKKLYKRAA